MLKYVLRSSFCPDIPLILDKEVVIGRGPLTLIKDSKVSREHLVIKCLGKKFEVRQSGINHSVVCNEMLSVGEIRIINSGDTFCLLEGMYEFEVKALKQGIIGPDTKEEDGTYLEAKPSSSHWNQGLISSMNDPEKVIYSNSYIVTIKDKYPKAKHHYLVLPKKKVATLHIMTIEDIDLLKMMDSEGTRLATLHENSQFKMGYHAVPSMAQVHLHVISTDFDSPFLKNKKHWNSFNTPYFISSRDAIDQMEASGKIKEPDKFLSKQWISMPLKCNVCEFFPKNMPNLKNHVKVHQ